MNDKTRRLIQRLTLTPYSVWAVLFIVVPLLFVAYYAFTDQNFRFTFDNISRFFTATSVVDNGETTREVHTYLVIFMRSLKLAVISTAVCLLMGYPLAYIMARASERTQSVLLTLIMIPMWMNFLIRTYAWMTILQDTGILNGAPRAHPHHRHRVRRCDRHGLRLFPLHGAADLLHHGEA